MRQAPFPIWPVIIALTVLPLVAFTLTAPRKPGAKVESETTVVVAPVVINTLNGAIVPIPPVKPVRETSSDGVCRRADRKC